MWKIFEKIHSKWCRVTNGHELCYYDIVAIIDWALDGIASRMAVGLMNGMGNNEFALRTEGNCAMRAAALMRFVQLA